MITHSRRRGRLFASAPRNLPLKGLLVILSAIFAVIYLVMPGPAAWAATASYSNTTAGTADASTLPVTMNVAAGTLPAGDIITDVNIAIDFRKVGGSNCTSPGGGNPYNNEIQFTLAHPGGTSRVLVPSGTYTGTTQQPRVVVTLDDEAATVVSNVPTAGTFRPVNSLSIFDGLSPFGTWTLSVTDTAGADILCFYTTTMTIVTAPPGPGVTINTTTVAVTEGGATANYTMVLNFAPTANVVVTADPDAQCNLGSGAGNPVTRTFTTGNWATAQSITVTAVDDTIDEASPHPCVITHSSSSTDAGYNGLTIAGVTANITDNDPTPTFTINDVTVTEGNSGTVNATFTVTLTSTFTSNITVNWATANGTATLPSDYAANSGTLTFPSGGALTQTVTVVVNGDTIDEGASEVFLVNLSGAVNATIGDAQGIGTITDDDNAPTISINDVTVTEGDSGTVNANFTVSLSAASGLTITVNRVTANNTAVAPGDYTALSSSTLTFNPGQTTQTVTVVVNGDTIDEGASETFFVNLSSSVNASILDNQGVGTITDDDNAPTISINDVTVTEGNIGTVNANFTVSLSNGSSSNVTVTRVTANNSAIAPGDYTALSSAIMTFTPGGALTQTVTVVVNGDTLDEGASETFFVNLSGAVNATIGDAQGIGTITDDDNAPTISINDVIVMEGNSGTVNATFTVTLSAASGLTVTVNRATADFSAVAPGDYTSSSGTVTFNPGQTTQTFNVVVNGDTLDEGASELFLVNLSGAVNATISDGTGVGTIADDDNAPVISINDVSVTEGNSGTVNATFTVTLSNGSSSVVTVNYATANGSATAPADYSAASGTVTFNPTVLVQTVTVTVNGDTIDEGASEAFLLNLFGAVNASIGDNQGIGTITDDDNAPTVSINDVTIAEGNSGTTNMTFTVSLNSTATSAITLDWATANGTASSPSDYAANSGTLTFPSGGALTQNVTVVVNGDTLNEPTETLFVNLTNLINATFADAQGLGTITNDDPLPSLSINDVTVTEGNSGVINATFTVTLSTASGQTISVDYATANDSAVAPGDYASDSGTLTFLPGGSLTQTVTVVVNGDITYEMPSEQFFVNLSGATNATISDAQGIGTITDDDNYPTVSIDDVTVTEGDAGTVNAVFTVSLTSTPVFDLTVDVNTANDTAAAPGDFTALSVANLTFLAGGATTQQVTVVVNGDTIDEGASEQFFVNLSNLTNGFPGDMQGVGTITDDDNAPVISINDVTVAEGDAGTVNAIFTVSLNSTATSNITVNYATADDSALEPNDYTTTFNTLTFAPGSALTQTITVEINGDTIDEGASEQFFVNLSGAVNATIADNQGIGTITDDDNAPVISINDVTVTEGDSGTVNATFTVSLSNASASVVTVDYATANDTAVAPNDYVAVPATPLTFNPGGALSQTITVVVNGDTIDEGASEQFFVNLSGETNSTIGDNQGIGTITDDDNAPVISINDVTVTEGDGGTVNAIFTVSLSNASASVVTVDYVTANDTAVAPADFTALPTTTLTFNPGVLSLPITVVVNGDTIDEGASEQFFVNLSGETNSTIADNQGVGTITDDDNAPVVSINDVTVTEGDSGTVNATFTVSLSNASASIVTVDYTTTNDTAVAPADFTADSGTLTFNPSVLSQTITVVVNGDTIDEGASEQFFVNLSGETNSTIADNQGIGTITDDDNAPVISINDVTVTEGDSGTVNATFTVSLSNASASVVTVDYVTVNDTAAAPADFTAIAVTTLTFNPGVLSIPITVVVNGDTIDEGASEQFFVNLSSETNSTIADNQGVGTITDDDNAPVISINDVTVTEGNTGTVNTTFTVSLSNASASVVTVDYVTANDTAVAPADFTALPTTTLTFSPGGALSQTVTVVVNGDTIDEGASEQFFVNLSSETNSTIADNQGVGTITDDDNAPVISINDVTVTEGDSGTVNATFTVSVNSTATSDITVNYVTANDTAAAPADFDAVTSTTLTFVTGGSLTQTLTVVVNGDTIDEGASEQFFINLASAVNATIGDAQGVGTITDDDNAPVISINDVTVTEGDSGTVNTTFTVSLSNASASVVTVDYVTANDTAAAPTDFTAIPATTLTFNSGGALSQTVTVVANGDTIDEGASEQFFVNLSGETNSTIADNQGVGTITDDDNAPVISINDVTVTEGDSGTVNATFTVSLSNASASIVTVDYVTANDTAAAPTDFTAPATTLTFNPGVLSLPITVVVNGDTIDEGTAEQFFVNLSSETNSTIGDAQGVGTITDDDNAPVIAINDVTVTEGNSGTVNAVFTVSVNSTATSDITVNYVTANDTAVAPTDFDAVTSTSLTFVTGGSLTQILTVVVNGDTIDEGASEQFFVNLSGAVNATIADNQGIGTITDDDNAPVIAINDITVTEGDTGTVNAVFTVSLSNASASIVTVDYVTANDTATAPNDYVAVPSTTVTFNPGGALSQTVTVVVNGDTIDEGASEQFFVNLSGATNSTIGDAQGVGTITDDDNAPVIAINDVTVTEGDSGTVNATFTVSVNSTATSDITVNYATTNDTAAAPADFDAVTSTTLTFVTGGSLTQTLTVVVNGDTIDEGASEQFFINLASAVNATIGDAQGVGTITDDDNAPVISINDVTVTEGDSGTVNATFTVSLSNASSSTVTVNYATANDTAVAPADFTAGSGTLAFNPSVLSQTLTVVVNGDTIDEGASEQFFVNLSGETNATIGDAQVVGTITDDDNAPVISINDVTVTEGDSGTVNATFTVSLSNASASIVTVDYATANDTAVAPADFTAIAATTLTFNPDGALSQTITVVVNGDTIDEGASEQFFVNLSGETNSTIGDNQGVGTITDDDNAPVISINDVTVTEGDAGTVNATFTVSLSNASASIVTVDYTTANDTAVAPADFTAIAATTLTFNPGGALSQTVTVVVNGDTIDEGAAEQFFVNLAGATNSTIGDAQGVGTITDDDNAPVISINDVTVTEGNSGTVNATFTVSLSNASASIVTVDYTTANDTAVAPADFTAIAATTLTFNPGGALSQTVTVVVNGDTIDEGASEQFFVNLSGATNSTIGDAQGVGTITDDDNAPVISINDVTVTEGNTGTVNATFTVSLSNASASIVTVNYATANDTAVTPNDYVAVPSTTLTFNPGAALSQTVTVAVNGDYIFEGISERFFVNLSGATNSTIGDNQGIGTITDDDTPAFTVTPVSADTAIVENPQPAPSQRYIFTVRLQTDPTAPVTLNLAVSNSQIRVGRPGGPFGNTLNLTFVPSGATPTAPNTVWNVTQTVEVMAADDITIETLIQSAQLTFAIQAGSAAEYVTLAIPTLTVSVRDNDGADSIAMFNGTTGQASLINTLQDLPSGAAYNTYTPGASVSGQWVMGDWNDDGLETPGVYGNGVFAYTNDAGPTSNWVGIWVGLLNRPPVVGRFDANYGNDCIGVVDSGVFPPWGTAFALYFTCDLTHGPTPPLAYQWLSVILPDELGYLGAHQFAVGDFNGDGIDTMAIRRGEAIAFTNVPPTTSNSMFDLAQYIGNPALSGGDVVAGQYGNLVSGDWNTNGIDSFGLFYPAGVLYYRNDLEWNTSIYIRQRMAQPVGSAALAVTWHPQGGATLGAGESAGGVEEPSSTTKTYRAVRIESDDARVQRTGQWAVQATPAASGGRYVYSGASTDDILTLEFEGTSVEVIYLEGQSLGSFTIVVDDIAVRTVIATQSETGFDRSTVINYLEEGTHTLQIVPIRGVVAIDAFVVTVAQ